MPNADSKKHFVFLYIGIVSIVAAFTSNYLFSNSILYYIFLISGIIAKVTFLLYSFRNQSHVKFIYFIPLLLGVIAISLSMYAKYVLEWFAIASVLLYIAIPLKIIGVVILIVFANKKIKFHNQI